MGSNRRKKDRRRSLRAAWANTAWFVRRTWIWMLLPAVLGAAGYGLYRGYWFIHTTPFFRIDSIDVTGCRRSRPQEIIELSGAKRGESVFDKDIKVMAELVYAHPWVASVKVTRKLPRRLLIDVTEREPAILVAMQAVYMADRTGQIFKRVVPGDEAKLPVVTGISRDDYQNAEERSRLLIRTAIEISDEFTRQKVGREVSEINVDPVEGSTVFTADRAVEIRFGRGRIAERVALLREVLSESARRGWQPAAIHLDNDFRTDWVAVKLSEK
jgi:cell division protein FtsQ